MLPAQTNSIPPSTLASNVLFMIQGKVEVARSGTDAWVLGVRGQLLLAGDRVRTGERSRAGVFLAGGVSVEKGELCEFEVPPSTKTTFLRGIFKIFNRQRNSGTEYRLPGATAAIRGTDFLVSVADDGRSEVTVLDGEVELRNSVGDSITITNRMRGSVGTDGSLSRTAVLEADNNLIQWCLYYPGVVNVDELDFPAGEKELLNDSLSAYREGDLLKAVATFPWQTTSSSDSANAYRAALLLAVGQVEPATNLLKSVSDSGPARALKQLVAAVKFEPSSRSTRPDSSSEWLAESYWLQSRYDLRNALEAARIATTNAPEFGFAWTHVAELEFSFGHTAQALAALENGLQLSPRNAQALALKGFLLSAQNNISGALGWFDQAIAADSALGNAWLGHGLCLIRQGRREEGMRDLLVAASLEPQRSLLRSYLGKAFGDVADDKHANAELRLAEILDPHDPTPWLYAALLGQQQNRINQGIGDLQSSQELNDNRMLFRSRSLLDKDRAVGAANLASLYQDAGMNEVSVREASKATTYDYANASAHLFLSDAYNELRDPTRFNLRYETVWFNELLLANTLAPIGGGRLSQEVSQQEYSRLFQADGLDLAASSDWRSDNMFHEQASQYGTFRNTSWAFDLDYQHNNGVRVNNDLDSIEWYTTIKQQVTPQDSALILVKYESYHSGDNFQYYDTSLARPNFRFDEYQQPILVGTWNHEWAPGVHTLGMFGRLVTEQTFTDKAAPQQVLVQLSNGSVFGGLTVPFDINYQNSFTIYTSELNQIFQWDRVTLSAGARYQSGTFSVQDTFSNPASDGFLFRNPAAQDAADSEFERVTGYSYLTVEPVDRLWLTGGVAYDEVKYPDNFRQPPVNPGEDRRSQVGPKAAVVWSPVPEATIRAAYAQSLGGVSLDESFRLEQTQLAGFPQAFRTLISESLVGSVAAPSYETIGLALDLKLGNRTYAGLEVQRLSSRLSRTDGFLTLVNAAFPAVPLGATESLDYREYSLNANIDRLISDDWVVGAGYKLTDSSLNDVYPGLLASGAGANLPIPPYQHETARLHHINGFILFNHPSGFFAKSETDWYEQENSGWTPVEPGDEFFQQNFYAGYRLAHRRVEIMLGLLNVTGQNYKLNPLTVYQELPRKRVLEARLNFVF